MFDFCQARACNIRYFVCFFHMNTNALHVSTRRLAKFPTWKGPYATHIDAL